MLLPIDHIIEHPQNARTIATSAEADAALMESMRTIGLLQPVLVVPLRDNPNWWELRAGGRRLRAGKALGWTEIAAVELEPTQDDVPETAMSAAENMVRAPMHPVDQWRAIRDLRASSGYSLDTAAAALGVNVSFARRMEWLGQMADPVLEALGQGDLPGAFTLRTIALAPHETQLAALGANRDDNGVDWTGVAEDCTRRRIAMHTAVFDPALMAWDEDLFAEPDDEDRFTTTAIDEFLGLQRKAIDALIAKSKGRYQAYEQDPQSFRASLPPGWIEEHAAPPKRFAKDDPRRVFVCLHEKGSRVGDVDMVLARPREVKQDIREIRDTPPAVRPAISKKTLALLAELKAEGVRAKLQQLKNQGPAAMLEALLLLFTFQNVHAGSIVGSPHGTIAGMVSPEGVARADLSDDDLCDAAAWLISSVITFDQPDNFRTSGVGAEWLAMTIGAEMPRTDTPDILKGIRHDALIAIAVQHGIPTSGTAGALRKRLTGALADWRAVSFGAPGPLLRDADPDEDQVVEDEPTPGIDWEDAGEAA